MHAPRKKLLELKVPPASDQNSVTQIFAERLKALRELFGLTQNELANELHVSRGTIGYYEKAERTADIVFLKNAASYFDVPVGFLLGITDSAVTEYGDVADTLHLSDIAISILSNSKPDISRFISKLIEADSFNETVEIMKHLAEFEGSNENEREYYQFLFSAYMLKLFDDVAVGNRRASMEMKRFFNEFLHDNNIGGEADGTDREEE